MAVRAKMVCEEIEQQAGEAGGRVKLSPVVGGSVDFTPADQQLDDGSELDE